MNALLRLLGPFVTLLHLLGFTGLLIILFTSKPFRSIAEAIKSATMDLGRSTAIATMLVSAILAMQLLTGALEQRDSGASPFIQLPLLGYLFSVLVQKPRLDIILIALSIVTLFWSIIARTAGGSRQPYQLGHAPTLWIAWLLAGLGTTAVKSSQVLSTELIAYIAAAASVLACIACIPYLDREVVHRIVAGIVTATLILTYLSILLSPPWSFTDIWTGGFRSGSRLQGTFPQPNVAGAFYALSCLVVLAQTRTRLIARAFWLTPIVLLVYLSGSRGAITFLIIGFAAVAMGQNLARRQSWFLLPSLGASLLIPIINQNAAEHGALAGRVESWRLAVAIGQSSPLLGGGSFPLIELGEATHAFYAHSQLLQSWAEGGLVGIVLLSVAIWATLRSSRISGTSLGLSALIGLIATFPFESPVRLYAPSFAVTLVIILLLATVKDRRAESGGEPSLPQAIPMENRA